MESCSSVYLYLNSYRQSVYSLVFCKIPTISSLPRDPSFCQASGGGGEGDTRNGNNSNKSDYELKLCKLNLEIFIDKYLKSP